MKKLLLLALLLPMIALADTTTYTSLSIPVQVILNWKSPASIKAGTALSSTQLNATSSVPGTFVYTPAAGTVLQAGTYTLTAVFTPKDPKTYPSAIITIALTVTGTTPPVTGNITPGMTTPQIQAVLNGVPAGSTVTWAAGSYNITAPLTVPCNGLQLTGPVSDPPTATLNASYTNNPILMYGGGCANLGAIRYLGFANTGAVYFGVGNNSNFTFEHNAITKLPSNLSNNSAESGLYFDGNLGTKLSNVLVQYNTFGDATSCAAVFAMSDDMGGHCAGILVSQGESNSIRIQGNSFIHVEEGVHFFQLQSWTPGANNSVCVSCTVSLNTFLNYHRIALEIQTSTPTDPIMIEHNAVLDPLNSSYGTFAISMACCQWGYQMATNGNSPGYILNDNVIVSSQPCGAKCPPIGVEFWGTGSQGLASLVEGTFANGYTWGYGGGSWAINQNVICGPMTDGGYITDQQHQGPSAAPTQSSNSTSAACQAKASSVPALTPGSGSFTGSMTIAMSNAGPNTSIYYTTDGSTPTTASKLYTAPFTVTATTTVKAVGMWGTGTQPKSYPAGYGYTPSPVVSATYTLGSPAQSVFNCSGFAPGNGTCKVTTVSTGGDFQTRNEDYQGSAFRMFPTGSIHAANSLIYAVRKVSVQAFSSTFTFVSGGIITGFVLQNTDNQSGYQGIYFVAGAGCEGGFFQGAAAGVGGQSPNNVFAISQDSANNFTPTDPNFIYSGTALYQAGQDPCKPNHGNTSYVTVNNISTSPVALNSPANATQTTTGHTYSATITYDGSNVTENLFDVTLGGTCTPVTSGTCFSHTWTGVNIPSLVGGANTAYVGITGSSWGASPGPTLIQSFSYTEGAVQ